MQSTQVITKKIMPKQLSEQAAKKIKAVNRTYGAKAEFMSRAKIFPPTFKRLLKQGNASTRVVDRVEAAVRSYGVTAEPDTVITIVCTSYGVMRDALVVPGKRPPGVVEAKQVICLLLLQEAGLSKKAIARRLEYHDHTSVIAVLKTITNLIATEADTRDRVERIRAKVRAV